MKRAIPSLLKSLLPTRVKFTIFHSAIAALLFHVIFFLLFQNIASAFFEPVDLPRFKPAEKEIKFQFADKKEPLKKEETAKPKEIPKNEPFAKEKMEKKMVEVPLPKPEKMIPPPKEEMKNLAMNDVPVPLPKAQQRTVQRPEPGRVEPGTGKEGQGLPPPEEKADLGKLFPKKTEKPKIPVTRWDLLSDSPVTPPQSESGQPYSGISFDSGFSPNLSFETKDFNWTDYASAIYIAIWRSWHNRLYLTLGNFDRWSYENDSPSIDGVTGVTFVIERNGNISEITLLYNSSIEPLDASAIDALKESVLPPLPENFTKERERVTARFIAETDIKAMKHWLPIYKYYGYF